MAFRDTRINGRTYDWSEVELTPAHIESIDYAEISYEGTIEPHMKLTLSYEDAQRLLGSLGNGYMTKFFTIQVAYGDDGEKLRVDKLVSSRIMKVHHRGDVTDFLMDYTEMQSDGKTHRVKPTYVTIGAVANG